RGDRLRLYSLRRGVSHPSGPEKSQAIKLPLHAEAEGLLCRRGLNHVSFESDCQQLVQIITASK
ncbi:hypothetical protein HID58_006503, partial [Brassica napus]